MFVSTANDQRRECRAEEYFDIAIDKTPPRKEQQWFTTNPTDVTWVSISDMGSCGTYISKSSEQLTQEAVDKFNIKVIPSNTVLLSFKLTVGRIANSTKYLEGKLKLTVNREKSRTVSVFAIRNFKFLGFALGRNGNGVYVRVHPKSWRRFKSKLKDLSSRKSVQSIKPSLEKIKVYVRGWLNYYGIASMKNHIDDINGWLYHRIRMCIWKQWKKPKTKTRNLIKMGVPRDLAWQAGNSRRGHWFTTHTVAVNMAMTKERLINSGFYDLATAYQSVHVNY